MGTEGARMVSGRKRQAKSPETGRAAVVAMQSTGEGGAVHVGKRETAGGTPRVVRLATPSFSHKGCATCRRSHHGGGARGQWPRVDGTATFADERRVGRLE